MTSTKVNAKWSKLNERFIISIFEENTWCFTVRDPRVSSIVVASLVVTFLIVCSTAGCIVYTGSSHQPDSHYQRQTHSDSISYPSYEDDYESQTGYSQYTSPSRVQTYAISGIGQRHEISDSNSVKLVISGIENDIYVHQGTQVSEIVVSGIDNVIHLPKGCSPRITKSGVDVSIIYY